MSRKVPEHQASGPALSGWARRLEVETGVVVSALELSPRDLAAAAEAGRLDLEDPEGRTVYLRAGDVLVAEGRLVRRRGKTCFEVSRVAQTTPLVPDGKQRPVLWQPPEWAKEDPDHTGLGKVFRQRQQE